MIDEIQNVLGWEHFVRRFMDMGFKFYITGSNASLLSDELRNRLTGRYLPVDLLPFSFREFLAFKGYDLPDLNRLIAAEQALLQRRLDEYLDQGGIPEPVKYPDLPLHRALYDDVLYRDIAARYRIDDLRTLKELAFYLKRSNAPPAALETQRTQSIRGIRVIRGKKSLEARTISTTEARSWKVEGGSL